MTFRISTDIDFNSTKTEILEFAFEHNSSVSKFQTNGPAAGNHLVEFTSTTLNDIKDISDKLNISYDKIRNYTSNIVL
mgnify:CR=1 FL=1|jgi:hypothetical protein